MRSVIIASLLLVLTVTLIIICAAYIRLTAEHLVELLPGSDQPIDFFQSEWKRSRGALVLSTDRNNITRIDSLIETARIYYLANDTRGYADSVSQIKGVLSEISCFEKFSLENLI